MIATATEQAPAEEAERTSTPPRPPAFVWKRPFPLNDRIGPGTLCVARPILCFDDDTAENTKRADILHLWARLQGDLHVTSKNGEYICRITGIDDDHLHVHCHHDLTELYISWGNLKMLCEVVPFPLPQLCEMGGAA